MNIMIHSRRQANLYDFLEKVWMENPFSDLELDREVSSLKDRLTALLTRPFSNR